MNVQENYEEQSIVIVVISLLFNRNGELARRFQERFPVIPGETSRDEIRRLNRFWRIELGMASPNSIDTRECLMDDCDTTRWVVLFREKVLPVIVSNDLPREGVR